MGWNGAGGWVMTSQERQLKRSRTVCSTFHWRGITSSVSVTSSPSLESLPPQHGQALGAGSTTRSRGRCPGRGARTGLRAGGARRSAVGFLGAGFSAAVAASLAAVTNSSSCSSNWSISLRPRSEEAPNLSCLSLAISNFRCSTNVSAPEARASAWRRATCSAANATRRASISSGMLSGADITPGLNHAPRRVASTIRRPAGAKCVADYASRCRPAYRPTATPRWPPRHRPVQAR